MMDPLEPSTTLPPIPGPLFQCHCLDNGIRVAAAAAAAAEFQISLI